MIKLSTSEVSIFKADFTYPALTGTNSQLIYINHNLNKHVHDIAITHAASDTNHPMIYNLDRNASAGAIYGYRCDGDQTKNTLTIRVYRFGSTAVDATARLISYGE